MSFQEHIGAVGTRLLAETKAGLGDDWQYLSERGIMALSEITALLAEAAVRGQIGEDVSVITDACTAALGNWESVAFVKAADRADAIRASVLKAIGEALEVVLMVGLKSVLPV